MSAYKGLLKEKEALENSVKVLSAVQAEPVKPPPKVKEKAEGDEGDGETQEEASGDPLGATVSISEYIYIDN